MAKDPAFLFYVTDFNDGTQDFTNEEVGAYLRILLFQFSQGHLPLERIKRKLGSDFDRIWPILQMKFKQDEQGLFYNLRLEEEQIKRKKYSESRKNNITKRYQKQVNNISSTYVQHMENENEDVIVNKDISNNEVISNKKGKSKKIEYPTIEQVREYFEQNGYDPAKGEKAYRYYSESDWKDSKGNTVKNWKQKMQGVWFKDENKIQVSNKSKMVY